MRFEKMIFIKMLKYLSIMQKTSEIITYVQIKTSLNIIKQS